MNHCTKTGKLNRKESIITGVKVRERPKGLGTRWIYIDHQGKRKAKQVGDKKLALEAARKIEAKLTLGDVGITEDKSKVPTFRDTPRYGYMVL